jgi:hypothetical protein
VGCAMMAMQVVSIIITGLGAMLFFACAVLDNERASRVMAAALGLLFAFVTMVHIAQVARGPAQDAWRCGPAERP